MSDEDITWRHRASRPRLLTPIPIDDSNPNPVIDEDAPALSIRVARIEKKLRWARWLIGIAATAALGAVGGVANGMLNAREESGGWKARMLYLEREVWFLRNGRAPDFPPWPPTSAHPASPTQKPVDTDSGKDAP